MKMEDGLIFISLKTESGTFIEQLYGINFSVVGIYYTSTITGNISVHCQLYDLLTNKKPSWFENKLTLDNIRESTHVRDIYLAPLSTTYNSDIKEYEECKIRFRQLFNNIDCNEIYSDYNPIINYINKKLCDIETCEEFLNVDILVNNNTNYLSNIISKFGVKLCGLPKIPSKKFLSVRKYIAININPNLDEIIRISEININQWIKQYIKQFIKKYDVTFLKNIYKSEDNNHCNDIIHNLLIYIKQQINLDEPIIININDIINTYDTYSDNKIKLIDGEYSIPIIGIISSNSGDKVSLKMKNGRYEIITTRNPMLERFNKDELIEILQVLDVVDSNHEYDILRMNITKHLISISNK